MRRDRAGLRRPQERGPQLCRGRAPGQHRRHARTGRDPAGGHERHVDRVPDEREQWEERDLAGCRVVEGAAVPAGLDALHDQRVGAGLRRR